MIKSKLGFIGWFNFSAETFFFLIITFLAVDTTSSYFFSYDIIPKADKGKNQGFLLLFVLIVFLIFLCRTLTILKLYKSVSVDIDNKTITLENILTRQKQLLSLKNFDGYYDSVRRSSYGSHKEILLIQNNKVINIISSEYNSNYRELLSSISDITYLGTLNYNLRDKIGILFNKQI